MARANIMILTVLFLSFIYPGEGEAMRFPPKDVEPVVHNGVKYTAPHWARVHGGSHNGGYIEARDAETGKKLWSLQVYKVEYDPSMETDVQDIFITSLNIENSRLIVVNEKKDVYEVDIEAKKVVKRGGKR